VLSSSFMGTFLGHTGGGGGRTRLAITSVACTQRHCTLWSHGVKCNLGCSGGRTAAAGRTGPKNTTTLDWIATSLARTKGIALCALKAAVADGPLPPDGRVRYARPNSSSIRFGAR
jgi:hypothetical protein